MKVKATNQYKKFNLVDAELNRTPEEGEVFEVNKERFEILNGNNKYNAIFVEKVIDILDEESETFNFKRTNKRNKE